MVFLQDKRGHKRVPDKDTSSRKEKKKRKKERKKMKRNDSPDPSPLQVPSQIPEPDDISIPPQDIPIPPELRLPTPVVDQICDSILPTNPIQDSIPQDSNCIPPIPPMPINYKKTSMKELEEKNKEINKEITSLQKQLKDLTSKKAHIESCSDFFERDQEQFMKTYQPPSTPPPPPRTPSPCPPSPPPRPSFLENLGSTLLAALPLDNAWSRNDHSYSNDHHHHPNNTYQRTEQNEDPLPESFTLFHLRSPSTQFCPPRRSPSPTPPPPPPRLQSYPPPHQHCTCQGCMHDRGLY